MTPLVRAEGLSRRFGEVTAVCDVRLTVSPGEVVGVIGANGAGKTTLIRMILGLLRPSGGRVQLFGEPPSRRTRRRLGYVPQSLGLWEDLTVEENLAFVAAAFGVRGRGRPDPELDAVRGRLVRELPLGLRRRVAFAAATGHRPELLVLDEPTSGVGPLGRARLWDAIRQAAEEGVAAIVTTHFMGEAEQCDRLLVMADCRAVAEGSIGDIVGGATVVRVKAEPWAEAFRALDGAGLPVATVGRSLRVPGASEAAVRAALRGAGIEGRLETAPETFEEAFVRLAAVP